MNKLSIGSSSWGEIHESIEFDENDDVRVHWSGDNTAFENARTEMRNSGENGWFKSRDMRQIALLGPQEVMLIAGMYGVRPLSKDFDEVVLKLFKDPDWKNLRVGGGTRSNMRAPKWR